MDLNSRIRTDTLVWVVDLLDSEVDSVVRPAVGFVASEVASGVEGSVAVTVVLVAVTFPIAICMPIILALINSLGRVSAWMATVAAAADMVLLVVTWEEAASLVPEVQDMSNLIPASRSWFET
jgi:chromate transport protein ChrA